VTLPGLNSDYDLIRLSVGALVVFGALYALDSFGVPGMLGVAVLVGAGVLIAKQGAGRSGPQDARKGITVRMN